MEERAEYTNAQTGWHWRGQNLYYYDLPIAGIKLAKNFWGKEYFEVIFNLPTFLIPKNLPGAHTLEEAKQKLQQLCEEVINKIKSYD